MTIKVAAIADALHVSPTHDVASNTSDIVVSAQLTNATQGPDALES
ncbi:MAG: hypothetical protein WCP98_06055 [Actinomycetes bacterium]